MNRFTLAAAAMLPFAVYAQDDKKADPAVEKQRQTNTSYPIANDAVLIREQLDLKNNNVCVIATGRNGGSYLLDISCWRRSEGTKDAKDPQIVRDTLSSSIPAIFHPALDPRATCYVVVGEKQSIGVSCVAAPKEPSPP